MSEAAAVKTHRYLRIGIVGAVALLAVSVAIETWWGGGQRGSISEYFYTPVREVFVGALVAIGLSLVALRSRDDAEDVLLNIAGMLSPLVALVPTPLSRTGADGTVQRVVPDELLAGVENNVAALLVLGPPALVFATATAWRVRGPGRRVVLAGLLASVVGYLALLAWWLADRDSFVVGVHYVAAVLLFVLISAVALVHARTVQVPAERGRRTARLLAVTYRTLAALVVMVLLAAAALALLPLATGGDPVGGPWLFWVETLLLGLFVVFWLVQTAEHWHEGSSDPLAGG